MDRFTTSDDVELAYDYDDSAPGDDLPVVLLHGFGVSGTLNFGGPGLIDALADDDRKTLVIDARGHGESGKPDTADAYGEARMAQDVRELTAALGIERYDVVGYSMGAVTATILAASEGERVRRLVLGGVGEGIVDMGGVDGREMPPEIIVQAMRAPSLAEVDHPLGQAWRAFVDTLGSDPRALALQAERMHRGTIDLAAITAATLVICGDRDGLAGHPERLADAVAQSWLEVLDGDHLGVVRHPRFVPAIVDFVGGEPAQAGGPNAS